VKERSSFWIMRRAIEHAAPEPKAVILLWTSEQKEKIQKYTKILSDYFKELGTASVRVFPPNSEPNGIRAALEEANVLYLPGGRPELLLEHIREKELEKDIISFQGVIIGNSAGALVIGKYCIITPDEDYPELKILPGLNLVPFSVEVHYEPAPEKDEMLSEISNKTGLVFALPENTAIIYSNGWIEVIGKVSVFIEGKKL